MALRTRRIRRWLIAAIAAGAATVAGIVVFGAGSTQPPAAPPTTAAHDTAAATASAAQPAASAHGTRGPRAALPESRVDPDAARKVALAYDKGRFNAFFDEKVFLATSVADGKLSIQALRDQLLNIEELKALPRDGLVLTGKPAAVTERMAMIDTLEAMSEDDPAALDALAEIGQKPFEAGLATPTKRAVAAEKYDVFVALARKNWELAKQSFLDLHNPALMDLLKPALIGGLVDSGLSRADAVRQVDALATARPANPPPAQAAQDG